MISLPPRGRKMSVCSGLRSLQRPAHLSSQPPRALQQRPLSRGGSCGEGPGSSSPHPIGGEPTCEARAPVSKACAFLPFGGEGT